VIHAAIGPIAVHLPAKIETNDQLRAEHPEWNMDLIEVKTGVLERHIAAEGECHAWDRSAEHRFFVAVHANSRLSAADDRLPDAKPPGVAHVVRGN
jgi:3-oxoacyl-[acyl-carrier-protein] synthase III